MYKLFRNVRICYLQNFKLYSGKPEKVCSFEKRKTEVPEIINKSYKPLQNVYTKFGDLKPIYRFPQIYLSSWLATLKIYVIPISVFYFISVSLMDEFNLSTEVEMNILFATVLIVNFKCILISLPFLNFVGFVYETPKNEIVLSYINFWGNRVDEKFEAGDLSFYSKDTVFSRYIRSKFYLLLLNKKTGNVYRINMKHADVFDEDSIIKYFGEIPSSAV